MRPSPVSSSGETYASMLPSGDSARWVTSAEVGIAKSMRSAAGAEADRAAKPTIIAASSAPAAMAHSHGPLCRPAPTAGKDDADPDPDNASSANVKSRADWNRSAGFFSDNG